MHPDSFYHNWSTFRLFQADTFWSKRQAPPSSYSFHPVLWTSPAPFHDTHASLSCYFQQSLSSPTPIQFSQHPTGATAWEAISVIPTPQSSSLTSLSPLAIDSSIHCFSRPHTQSGPPTWQWPLSPCNCQLWARPSAHASLSLPPLSPSPGTPSYCHNARALSTSLRPWLP